MFSARSLKPYSPWFVIPAFALFGLFFVVPNLTGLFMAFTDWSSYYPLKPSFIGLANFKDMFAESIFATAIRNTLYFALVTTFFKITLGFLLAIILNNKIKFKSLYRTLIFSPIVVNPLVVAIVFSALYHPVRGPINVFLRNAGLGFLAKDWLTNTDYAMNAICLMDIWMGIGTIVVIFLAGLQSVPQEYYEASTIDGAGSFRQLIHITLPLSVHSLTISTILCLISGMKVFGQVYGLTNGGPADSTQVYGTFIFKSFSQGLFGYSAAASLVFSVVICLVSFLALRVFRKWEVEY